MLSWQRRPIKSPSIAPAATTLYGFFVGQVMRATQGKANPALVNQLLREKTGGVGTRFAISTSSSPSRLGGRVPTTTLYSVYTELLVLRSDHMIQRRGVYRATV